MTDKLFQIRHRYTDKVIFELKCESLSGAHLRGADLSGANLYEADLYRADLSGANLGGADLSRANLFEADLSGAYLRDADLSRADLSRADLCGAYLRDADLSGADLSGANLFEAHLSGAVLSGADGEKTTIEKTPIQIIGLNWPIIIFDNDMRIGCEYHSLADWWNFSDEQIEKMDDYALVFWRDHKKSLQRICAVTGRVCE